MSDVEDVNPKVVYEGVRSPTLASAIKRILFKLKSN